jgi:hypothetical protein
VAVVIAAVAAIIGLAGAVVTVTVLALDDEVSPHKRGEANLSEVRQYHELDPTHVAPGEEVDYPQSPPVGGNHAPMWLECGVYDQELPEEYVVHDLEHGAIWITYRGDDLDSGDIERLAGHLPDNGLMSPYDGQDAPVVITAWGRQLELTGPRDPRIPLFIAEYGDGSTAPEPFASCHGGLDPDDAEDAADGPVV